MGDRCFRRGRGPEITLPGEVPPGGRASPSEMKSWQCEVLICVRSRRGVGVGRLGGPRGPRQGVNPRLRPRTAVGSLSTGDPHLRSEACDAIVRSGGAPESRGRHARPSSRPAWQQALGQVWACSRRWDRSFGHSFASCVLRRARAVVGCSPPRLPRPRTVGTRSSTATARPPRGGRRLIEGDRPRMFSPVAGPVVPQPAPKAKGNATRIAASIYLASSVPSPSGAVHRPRSSTGSRTSRVVSRPPAPGCPGLMLLASSNACFRPLCALPYQPRLPSDAPQETLVAPSAATAPVGPTGRSTIQRASTAPSPHPQAGGLGPAPDVDPRVAPLRWRTSRGRTSRRRPGRAPYRPRPSGRGRTTSWRRRAPRSRAWAGARPRA